jgi:hypothetical protein
MRMFGVYLVGRYGVNGIDEVIIIWKMFKDRVTNLLKEKTNG